MKKWLSFLAFFLCFLFCVFPVRADLIWEPQDSFYEKHSSLCDYVGRHFTADGPDGIVILYESPESPKVVDTWENGYKAYISYTYTDGKGVLWGISDSEERIGWMPMDYMKVVYDHISFEEDFGSEIMEQSGVLGEQYREGSVCLWSYPGSRESFYSMEMTDKPDLPQYRGIYTDEKGYSWGYVGYYYGHRNFWICLDQPDADYEQLYPDGGPRIGAPAEDGETGDLGSKQQETERIVPEQGHGMVFTVSVLTTLVVLVTAVLLVVLRKGK